MKDRLIKVPLSSYARMRDLDSLADCYVAIQKCPGGRLIQKGFICPHCGNDPTIEGCGEPLKKLVRDILKERPFER